MKVKFKEKKVWNDYLTPGKEYDILYSNPLKFPIMTGCAFIEDDFGFRIVIKLDGPCHHIGSMWEVVEEG